jgi:hypothetical protein
MCAGGCVDAVRQRQFRHRNARLQTGFDQLSFGLRVVAKVSTLFSVDLSPTTVSVKVLVY